MNPRPWLNGILFDANAKRMFLLRLHALLKAELPLRSVFENIRRFSAAPMERKIAAHSLRNISLGQPFALGYDERGWFSANLSALLIAGEENMCLLGSLERALSACEAGLSAFRVIVLDNLRWLIGALVALAACVFLHMQRDLFIQIAGPPQNMTQRWVFAVGEFIALHGANFALVALSMSVTLWFALRSLCGSWREMLDHSGIFRHYRRAFVADLLPQMAGFMATGLGAVDALSALARIHTTPYRCQRLRAIRLEVASGTALDDALGQFLIEERHMAVLKALVAANPGRIHRALEELAPIVARDIESAYRSAARRCGLCCMVILMLAAYGVLEVIYATPVNLD